MMITPEVQTVLETLSSVEREALTQVLSLSKLEDSISNLYDADYKEVPVSIDQFVTDPRYLGDVYDSGNAIYPYWRNFIRDFFHNNVDKAYEVVISGAIGTGKSTIMSIMMTYSIYKVMCLKDPRKFYSLTGNAAIVFVVINLTLDLAYAGLYTMIVENIRNSPWFKERVDIRGKYDYSIEFGDNISLIAGSNTQHVVGKNVFACTLDEVNFSRAPAESKNSVMAMYRSIRRRMESRFMKTGNIPGFIGMISSKNDANSFLEVYIEANRFNKKTIVVDKPIYEIKPPETYLGPKFEVAVGDKVKESFLILDEEARARAVANAQLIIQVPIEYQQAFETDINESLKEIAGIAVFSTNKLIPYPGKIEACIDPTRLSPVCAETIYLSLTSDDSIMDFLDDLSLLRKNVRAPRFIHVDIALKGDSLGLVVTHVEKDVFVERTQVDGRLSTFVEPLFEVDLALRIRATPGSEIPLYRIREFILWLKKNLYHTIQLVTFDGFQSADSIQILKTAGVESSLLSVDKTEIPYTNLRSIILDRRLSMYKHSILLEELYNLEYDRLHKRIDHPETTSNNKPGSKDVSDALAGAIYDATLYYSSKEGKGDYNREGQLSNNISVMKQFKKGQKSKKVDAREDISWV